MKHTAFNTELPASAPEWIQLLPAGPDVVGVDGRRWLFDQVGMVSVLNAFARRAQPLVIDWEHATELRGAAGLEAPASGWIRELQDRGGELWARVEWNARAAEQIRNREYRYISPVFTFQKSSGRVAEVVSAGLTNVPNLRLTALNRESQDSNQEDDMPLKLIAKALGLDDGATADQILTATNSLKAKAEQTSAVPVALCRALGLAETATPESAVQIVSGLKTQSLDLTRFVPRADYELATNRANDAEARLKAQADAQAEAEINGLVDQAVKDGKVAPASKDFYLAACRQQGGVEEFKKFLGTAPVIAPDKTVQREVGADGAAKLTDVEQAMCKVLDLDPKDYAKTLGKEEK
ncbi:Mu-like prophage I protein [Humidesulfovibrio mexicanus]|uniref:Mu-like prophage I protein n=1 Tax=Humidesulfovibrio mexicanus TaxID=147047 RepID=A0A239BDV6_9BACT|nr:phage protease [Humidesulfovibrio mexicanus]SNS05741.1 Mu-like prophage I protein [Humidesulfovibrio mexicanus]